MKSKSSILLILMILAITFSSLACTDQNGRSQFSGLWEGVDPGNGSLTQRQITCEKNNSCFVLGASSFWSFCGSARGLLSGEGLIEGKELKIPGFTLKCTEGDRQISVDTTFSLDLRNRELFEQTVNPDINPITFNQVSR